jgi:hypothetical protein
MFKDLRVHFYLKINLIIQLFVEEVLNVSPNTLNNKEGARNNKCIDF